MRAVPDFEDMLHLFRQFTGRSTRELPARAQVEEWMERYPSGLDPRMVRLREENRDRVLYAIIRRIESGEIVETFGARLARMMPPSLMTGRCSAPKFPNGSKCSSVAGLLLRFTGWEPSTFMM